MARRILPGCEVEVDEGGYLVDSCAWTPEIAEELARECGLEPLTPRHWRVLLCLREAAAITGGLPDLFSVVRLSGLPLREVDRLFRQPPLERMAKIAGLPRPSA